MHRFLEEEAQKQSNIEAIALSAIPLLEDKSSPENIENDWITNFFDKSRIISDIDMQSLWARVLAGEANTPGSFAKRTVNLLGDLDKEDAELFVRLCGFGWIIGNIVPLVLDVRAGIYNQQGVDFSSLSHLESLGLVQFNHIGGFSRLGIPKRAMVLYYGKPVMLVFPSDADNAFEVGNVLLTRAGQQLAPVCGSHPVEGFFEYVQEKWAAKKLLPNVETDQIDPTSGDK
jgi:hypothetical protein